MTKKLPNIPKNMQQKYDNISRLTDRFSDERLNDEYKALARQMTAKLCRKKRNPLNAGTAKVWACAIIHALGMVNFLSDKSNTPYVTNAELIDWFGVGQSTASGKSKQIREMFKISQLDYEWMLPSRINSSPMVWYISVNGFIVDIRQMPIEVQEIAFDKGLIPYIPGVREVEDEK
ncbi:MAG: DUF6398 domain-containing protein [Pseudomonadota bacterium]